MYFTINEPFKDKKYYKIIHINECWKNVSKFASFLKFWIDKKIIIFFKEVHWRQSADVRMCLLASICLKVDFSENFLSYRVRQFEKQEEKNYSSWPQTIDFITKLPKKQVR